MDTATGKGTAKVPQKIPAKISLVPGTVTIDNTIPGTARKIAIPLKMAAPDQEVDPSAVNTVALTYEYPLTVKARDGMDRPVRGAMIDVFDRHQSLVGSGVTGGNGNFVIGVSGRGTYYVSQHSVGGFPAIRESAQVNSPGEVTVLIKGAGGEALTDLGAYPVLTEEVSTTGTPAPVAGGRRRRAGAGYGQAVDQAMRDVLGWRPGGDVAGFQAALTGAFQLREVEGHTEWTWQQRGYAVQADMGALTGAQASIYARAKSALDQILPLLAGLTPLNPALFPPQDLEAIRTVVTTELQELVSELALRGRSPDPAGGRALPPAARGKASGRRNLNPDVVQGNLGTLRDRFGLTVDEIDTVDEERIVTNFRIVVEQVLSLQASWSTDRGLLSRLDSRASFGTVLIWLSRGLEAVCRVGRRSHLRPGLRLRGRGAAAGDRAQASPASRRCCCPTCWTGWSGPAGTKGPRIIQDAGKDGVFAFAPVLRRLRDLIRATRHAARHERGLPHGMRTPRVDRALQVLVAQLGEATDLAGQVRRDAPPRSRRRWSARLGSGSGRRPAGAANVDQGQI